MKRESLRRFTKYPYVKITWVDSDTQSGLVNLAGLKITSTGDGSMIEVDFGLVDVVMKRETEKKVRNFTFMRWLFPMKRNTWIGRLDGCVVKAVDWTD